MKQASLICATVLLMLIVGTLFATFYGKQEVQKLMLATAYQRMDKLEAAHNALVLDVRRLRAAHNQVTELLAKERGWTVTSIPEKKKEVIEKFEGKKIMPTPDNPTRDIEIILPAGIMGEPAKEEKP